MRKLISLINVVIFSVASQASTELFLPKVTYVALGSSVKIRTRDLSTREPRHTNIENIKEQINVVSFVYDRGSFFATAVVKRGHTIFLLLSTIC